jgi:hypothetical protein
MSRKNGILRYTDVKKSITRNLEEYCHGQFEESVPVLAWRERIKLEIP